MYVHLHICGGGGGGLSYLIRTSDISLTMNITAHQAAGVLFSGGHIMPSFNPLTYF